MLALKKALNDIKNRIPSEILTLAFMSRVKHLPGNQKTLDDQITTLVLKNIVLQDMNVIRGDTCTIPLNKCRQYRFDYNPTTAHIVIDIPYELTDNKEVLSVLGLTGGNPSISNNSNKQGSSNPLLAVAGMSVTASNPMSVQGYATTNVELIGPNTVMVHDKLTTTLYGYIRVAVENDSNFRNINNRMANAFSSICLKATKGYIYNKLVVELDKGYIYGGHELSKVSSIVESWENIWEEYDTELKEKWAKISFMNDDEAHSRFIKMSINPIF